MGTHTQEQVTLLTDYDTASAYSTAYNTIYNNIRFDWDRQRLRQYFVLFATPAPYAGASMVPTNIAITAAQNGTPTLLIDGDLHTPGLHQRFGIGEQSGLSDILAGETINPSILAPRLHKTFIPGLSLLCAGSTTHAPAEISRQLTTHLGDVVNGLRQLLQETQPEPALVIFHSPPVIAGIDAALISSVVDRTLLVIANGRTTRSQAQKAREQLERAHAQVAGAILVDA